MTKKAPKTGDSNECKDGNITPSKVADSKGSVPKFLLKFGVKPGEWFYGLKTDLRVFMRPGWDLRVRVYAFLLQFTRAYRSEFAITQVGDHDGSQKFAPVTPAFICAKLRRIAGEEFRKSADRKPTDAEAAKWVIRPQHMRRILESMQTEDGTLTTVTATKLLAPDAATRKRGRADLLRLMAERLSFKDALAQKLITPIETLGKRDRKRLAGISFLYLHVEPRPATVGALMRRTEDDVTDSLSQASKAIHAELDGRAQLAFKFLRAEGINDPVFAAELAAREDMRLQFDEVQRLEERRLALNVQLKESVHLASEQYKSQRPSPAPSGKEQNTSGSASNRGAVETPSAALNSHGRESLIPELRNATAAVSSPDRRAAESMGRNVERHAVVIPAGNRLNPSAPPVLTASVGRNSNGGAGRQSVVAHQTARTSPPRPTDSTSAAVQPSDTQGLPSPVFGSAAESPLVSQPRGKVLARASQISKIEEGAAAEFNNLLCIRFRAVRASAPTRSQTDPIFNAAGGSAESFLAWLSPAEMKRRKPQHGGVLPSLFEEFEKLVAMGPAPEAEESYVERRAREINEDHARERKVAANG